MNDFASYKAKEQKPLYGFYHGKKVVTAPLPAGGPVLISILNILEGFIDSSLPSNVNIHRMVESFKFGYAQRTFVKLLKLI
jgi:gamma-glutamyltranspeptidase